MAQAGDDESRAISELKQHFDGAIEGTESRIQHHFDVVAESLESKIQLVAEGVVTANERLDRLHEELRGESEETRAIVKLSYAQLDRRVATLEGTVASLSRRIEVLEEQRN